MVTVMACKGLIETHHLQKLLLHQQVHFCLRVCVCVTFTLDYNLNHWFLNNTKESQKNICSTTDAHRHLLLLCLLLRSLLIFALSCDREYLEFLFLYPAYFIQYYFFHLHALRCRFSLCFFFYMKNIFCVNTMSSLSIHLMITLQFTI